MRADPPLRVLFAGTPEFALPPLQGLLDEACDVIGVLTQPDRPAGRGRQLKPSPVKRLALERGLAVFQPQTLRGGALTDEITGLEPDLMVVVAYGLMIPAEVLSIPRLGCWNIHASLLPRWRGAAPIQRAIEAGDRETGVCVMRMEASLDTGPLLHCLKTPIGPQDTAATLHDRLAALGARALRFCLRRAAAGRLGEPRPQNDAEAVYAPKLSKDEARLDFSRPARVLERQVRAFNPWPVAWCELDGQRLRIWQAAVDSSGVDCRPGQVITGSGRLSVGTADGVLEIRELQRAGGRRMPVEEFLRARDAGPG